MKCPRPRSWSALILGLLVLGGLAPHVGCRIESRDAVAAQGSVPTLEYQRMVERLSADDFEGRGPDTEGLGRARDYILAHLEALGLEPAFLREGRQSHLQAFSPNGNGGPTQHNIAAILRGNSSWAEQVIVVGGHYDHLGMREEDGRMVIYPGADDNASGVAGLLTLAARFAADPGATDTPRRTLLFVAFAGEEAGLFGSAHFVRHLHELGLKQGQLAAMVCLDMIGRMRHRRLLVFGADSADRWRRWLSDANAVTRLRLTSQAALPAVSDHVSFYACGVPVLLVSTDLHADHHRPTDTAEKINTEAALKVVDLAERVLRRLLTDPERLVFKPDPTIPLGYARERGLIGAANPPAGSLP